MLLHVLAHVLFLLVISILPMTIFDYYKQRVCERSRYSLFADIAFISLWCISRSGIAEAWCSVYLAVRNSQTVFASG